MKSHPPNTLSVVRWTVPVLLLAAASSLAGSPGGDTTGFNTGKSFFSTDDPCPVKEFPTFESVVPVPAFIDPFEEDVIPFFCTVQVQRNNNPVSNAKGKFRTDLMLLDNNTGEFTSQRIDSGRFTTGESGFTSFDFDLPAELFADGFESGDVSAWSYTRTDFTNKKKGTTGNVSCTAQKSSSS